MIFKFLLDFSRQYWGNRKTLHTRFPKDGHHPYTQQSLTTNLAISVWTGPMAALTTEKYILGI